MTVKAKLACMLIVLAALGGWWWFSAAPEAHAEIAATCQSNGSGSWNNAATWTNCNGSIPGPGDSVQIQNGHTVTLNVDPTSGITNIAISNGGILQVGGGGRTLAVNTTVEGGGALDLGAHTLTISNTTVAVGSSGISGVISGTAALRTRGNNTEIIVFNSTAEPPLVVENGTTKSQGRFNNAITVNAGATLETSSNLYVYGDVNVAGDLIVGSGSGHWLYFYGETLTNTGAISGPGSFIFARNGAQTLTGAGDWSGGEVRVDSNSSVTFPADFTLGVNTLTINGELHTGADNSFPNLTTLTLSGPFYLNANTLTLTNTAVSMSGGGRIIASTTLRMRGTSSFKNISSNAIEFPVVVESGKTEAGGRFNDTVTVNAGATLQTWSTIYTYDDVNVAGSLALESGDFHFYGETVTNTGAISGPRIFYFARNGAQTLTGAGDWNEGSVSVNSGSSVALPADLTLGVKYLTISGQLHTGATNNFPNLSRLEITGPFHLGDNTLTLTDTTVIMAGGGAIVASTTLYARGNATELRFSNALTLPLVVENGLTKALGTFNNTITVNAGATLRTSSNLYAYGDVNVAGGLTLWHSTSFYGETLTNTGIISGLTNFHFARNGAQTLTGAGEWSVGDVRVDSGSSVTFPADLILNVNHFYINGTLNLDGDLTVGGNWIHSGHFNPNGHAVTFAGAGSKNLTANAPLTFANLTVNSGVTLVETVAADQVNVAQTLTNHGVIRKAQTAYGVGWQTFGLTGARIQITTYGGVSTNLTVALIGSDHPTRTERIGNGHYFDLSSSTGGHTFTVVLPHNLSGGTNLRACRYNGAGPTGWECGTDEDNIYDTKTVTRTGVTQFSTWAVGGNVGPNAVTLRGFTAHSPLVARLAGLSGLLTLAVGPRLWGKRRLDKRRLSKRRA